MDTDKGRRIPLYFKGPLVVVWASHRYGRQVALGESVTGGRLKIKRLIQGHPGEFALTALFIIALLGGVGLNSLLANQRSLFNYYGGGGEPTAPLSVGATGGDTVIDVTWNAPASEGASPVTGYTVWVRHNGSVVTTDTVSGSTFADQITGLTNGLSYDITVAAMNATGAGPESSPPVSATPSGKPGQPTIDTVTPGNQTLNVAWSPPVDNGGTPLTGYLVDVTEPSGVPAVADQTVGPNTTTATFSGLVNGKSYSFTVTAQNANGDGSPSAAVAGTPSTTPGAPTITSVTPGNQSLDVNWTAPVSDGGSALTGYSVVATPQGGGTPVSVNVGGGVTSTTINGLTNGQPYDVTVTASNANGAGPDSASVAGTPSTTPAAPTITSVTPGNHTLDVVWTAPSDTGGSAITGYTVTAVPQGGGTTKTKSVGVTLSTTIDTLVNGTTYDVTVKATNTNGSGPDSAAVAGTPSTVPGAPTLNTVTPGNHTLNLAWTAPNNGGSALTGYKLSATPQGGGSAVTGTAAGGATTGSIVGLVNGTTYDVTVTATNANGDGPVSNVVAGTPSTVPGAPTITSMTPGDQELTVTWNPPADTGGSPITGFTVTATPQGGGAAVDATPAPGASATSATITGLTNGVTYDVTVKAVNANGPGPASAAVPGTPSATTTVPDPPVINAATPGDGTATIDFSAPINNGGLPVDFYRVTATPVGGGAPVVGNNVTGSPYTLGGLTNGVDYDVVVEAHNANGFSAPSASRRVRPTGAAPVVPVVRPGYWLGAADGGLFAFGQHGFFGSMVNHFLAGKIVGITSTPDGQGYWMVGQDGGVFAFGNAGYHGGMGGIHLNSPIAGIVGAPDGQGYWLVGEDGGVFAFGSAHYAGSMGGVKLTGRVVAIVATPDGQGYWLVGEDGGVFAFGNAPYLGSTGGLVLDAPIMGIARNADSTGYWLASKKGAIYRFGTAGSFGSTAGDRLNAPMTGIRATPDGQGYWLTGGDGGVFAFGDAEFAGTMANKALAAPVVGIA
ncbi:MAG: hypothetical protein QOI20_614 [Acidimicrobiaceae bacterium]|nr:hypothetical protein [Acidimicrobiaceae bacterium]